MKIFDPSLSWARRRSWKLKTLYPSLTGLAIAMIAGCAAEKVPLEYNSPSAQLKPGGRIVAFATVDDQRTDRSIDETIAPSPATTVDQAMRDEVAGAAIARQVLSISDLRRLSNEKLKKAGIDMVIEPTLEEMVWEVPGYNQMMVTTFMVSLVTGGIGGVIYGMTPTDVHGRTKVTVRTIDLVSGTETTKTYTGTAYERMKKLSCDSDSTKRKMVGQSLRSAMEQWRSDLTNHTEGAPR